VIDLDLQRLLANAEGKLSEVHPNLAEKGRELIKRAHAAGVNICITQGLRSIEYQNQLYAQGRTTKGQVVTQVKGGYSYHNYGLAIDFGVLKPDGSAVDWNTSTDLDHDGKKDWYEVGAIGESIGLEWGGSWTGGFVDIPHFQLTFGLSCAQLRAGNKPPAYVPSEPLYHIYQGDKLLCDCVDYGDAVEEAKKWANSYVCKISDGAWVWTNIPATAPEEPKSEDDEPMKLEKWAVDMLVSTLTDFKAKGYFSDEAWITKAKNGTLTTSELAFLNTILIKTAVSK
jgi:peptidoglycan L-alanyl-D-glutamate endopeptidase CwlK